MFFNHYTPLIKIHNNPCSSFIILIVLAEKFRGNSIKIMNIIGETVSFLSSDSLFSTIITLYTLLLLYLPSSFLRYILSPVTLSTLILLLYLLRLGATQKFRPQWKDSGSGADSEQLFPQQIEDVCGGRSLPPQNYAESFVEWDVRAPLEVIYELEYEGDDAFDNGSVRESEMNIIQRYASLSLFYPESDSDASSEGDFRTDGDHWENMCFRWEEEEDVEDREGMIEIALEDKIDEDNLIEIDLSPGR